MTDEEQLSFDFMKDDEWLIPTDWNKPFSVIEYIYTSDTDDQLYFDELFMIS